jgi:hypothetical protein
LDYLIDNSQKPRGKWITLKYISLDSFPPEPIDIRLQPPHIAKGYFQNFDRTFETQIVAVGSLLDAYKIEKTKEKSKKNQNEPEILQFPTLRKD